MTCGASAAAMELELGALTESRACQIAPIFMDRLDLDILRAACAAVVLAGATLSAAKENV
jgi:hypothetical protein